MEARRSRIGFAATAVVAVALTAGCGSSVPASSQSAATSAAPAPTPRSAVRATTSAAAGTDGIPGPTTTGVRTPRRLQPVRITIPAIDVNASMTDLGIASDGSIEVPSVPAQAGWLDTTPAPGEQGPAVVAGHVDSTTGPAVFYLLSTLEAGDEVTVTRRDGSTASFTVDGVRTYAQDAFPTSEVYGPVPGPALRLVTCGGDYVKADGGYQSNVVVYAS